MGWRRSLGAGIVLGLALGCAWLAHWTPVPAARISLIGITIVLAALGAGLLGSSSSARGWRAALGRKLEERFAGAGVPFFTALVLLALAAIATGNNLLYLVVSGLLAILIVSGLASALNLSGMVLRFRLPPEIFAGQGAAVRLTLSNDKGFWPAYSLCVSAASFWVGAWPGAAARTQITMPPVYVAYLPRRASVVVDSQLGFPRRGRYAATAFSLTTRFPFGLLQKRRRFQSSEKEPDILVYPAPAGGPAWAGAAIRAGTRAQVWRRGEGREIHRIRPHQPGDSARHVHWKATARAGELRVREFNREATSHVRLRLALRQDLSPEEAEAGVSLCAAWLLCLIETGDRLEAELWLEFVGEHATAEHRGASAYWLPSTPASRQRGAVLEYLALVEPGRRAPSLPSVHLDPDAFEIRISGPDAPLEAESGSLAAHESDR